MKERIRELEDALAILQAKNSNESHPLLRDDLVRVDAEPEEEVASEPMQGTSSDIMDAFGTLSMSDYGVSRFFGPTGGSEVRTSQMTCRTSVLIGRPPRRVSRTVPAICAHSSLAFHSTR